jgi:hypothetical protein
MPVISFHFTQYSREVAQQGKKMVQSTYDVNKSSYVGKTQTGSVKWKRKGLGLVHGGAN